jgi:tRNA nucleotidyltransferase (CCA-adding enzyme)
LTEKEQKDASRRQNEIRGVMDEAFKLERDFLTGSYKRHTKAKRLKDVDIFCVFHDDERPKYRIGKAPSVILDAVEKTLGDKYGRDKVKRQRRSASVQFPNDPNDPEQVMSFDVVPAFEKGNHLLCRKLQLT